MKRKTVYTLSALAAAAGLAGALTFAAPAIAVGPGGGPGYGPGYGYGPRMAATADNDDPRGAWMGRGGRGGAWMGRGDCTGPNNARFNRGPRGFNRGGGFGGGPFFGGPANVNLDLTVDQARVLAELRLKRWNNPNLKVGEVTQKDDNTIAVQIVTKDNSLVATYDVDRKTGRPTPAK